MLRYTYLSLLCLFLTVSCARKNYFQKSALVAPISLNGKPVGDSAVVVAGAQYDRGAWHRFWLGNHYRKVWAQPVTLPLLDLAKIHGGLKPESMGGGFQTTSLTLQNPQGRQFALRSVDKDPQEVLPKSLRKTFVTNILRDQTSAAHPYGAAVVSALATSAQIPHSHPRFVYIPKEAKGLGENSVAFKDKVFLFEEKFEGTEALTQYFGEAKNLVDSEDYLHSRFTMHSHLPNQKAFAKARLFDVLIGDWDRHEGQWQWAVYDTGGVTTYAPVPKDRDQAFFKFDDGVIPWLFSRRWAPLSKMKTFHKDISSVRGYLQNSSFIDERTLNEVTEEQWKQLAKEVQAQLTNQNLQEAVAALPTEVYALSGEEILAKLRSRREQLPEAAQQMYRHLAENVLVPGTDQKEIFEIERQPDGNTLVKVFQKPAADDQKPMLVFERLFVHGHTKSISLYGLGQEDEFKISGKADRGILINVYGGMGEDEVEDTSSVRGWSKKTKIYDTKRGITVKKGKETSLQLSKTVEVHAFDREGL